MELCYKPQYRRVVLVGKLMQSEWKAWYCCENFKYSAYYRATNAR